MNSENKPATMGHPLLTTSLSPDSERHFLLEQKISFHAIQESDRKREELGRLLRTLLFLVVAGGAIWLLAIVAGPLLSSTSSSQDVDRLAGDSTTTRIPLCASGPCFVPAKIRVASDRPGFPSFWKYAHRGPLHVGYDSRAILLNGERSFFLGGSFHPSRATKMTWNYALDEAVRNGLNLITLYVMWSAHQILPNSKMDWGFPGSYGVACEDDLDHSCGWNLASSIRSAADRGIFVHLRIGPYDCAEYNYGGIPEWLSLHKPKLEMRRPNREWLDVMKSFVTSVVTYVTDQKLWAHQGGNIIMAQIENELGADGDFESPENRLLIDDKGNFVDRDQRRRHDKTLRNATIQDYANWCGEIAEQLAPNVTWTMCNGLYANNTILTCNAIDNAHVWLEKNGGNGRIQVDQPAVFTEFEGGFQTWGSTAEKPLDYFWGRTARATTRDAMKWFARGGCHLNYYMFFGGYNRGRAAAAGITNMYASDVPLCPSGQRRQPKFGHYRALHEAMTGVASTLLAADTSLRKGQPLRYQDYDGLWKIGTDQRAFEYRVDDSYKHVMFVENDASNEVIVELPPLDDQTNVKIISMNAYSSILLVDGMIEFDSSSIDPRIMSVERKYAGRDSLPLLLDWVSWQEPLGAHSGDATTWTRSVPVEQTELNADSGVSSDYAWYETTFILDETLDQSNLYIETQMANAFVVFIDGEFVGSVDHHLKKEGPITLALQIGRVKQGKHKLHLLSESLGYLNLIGRWGGSTMKKQKGITGDVILSLGSTNVSLVDGREWRSYPGLHGEALNRNGMKRDNFMYNLEMGSSNTPTWSSTLFDSPRYDPTQEGLFVKITSGRGHLWLNGRDLGRYWNITRGESSEYSQKYYFFPDDYLHTDGRLNELILFDAFGEPRGSVELELSWIAASDTMQFEDEVDFPEACI